MATGISLKCSECGAVGNKWEFQGEYCSQSCADRHAGREILGDIKYNHTWCFSCFRQLKEIEPPKPNSEFRDHGYYWTHDGDYNFYLEYASQEVTKESACGFQYLTDSAEKGMKQWGDKIFTGTICGECGQTDHTDHDPVLSGRESIALLVTLLSDRQDLVVDPETIHREYEETRDLLLAVGCGVTDKPQPQ